MNRTIAANVLLPAALLIGGCDYINGTHTAHETVRNLLVDPGSAVFRNDRHGKAPAMVCGEVNMKTPQGQYTGFTPYVYGVTITTISPGPPDFAATYRLSGAARVAALNRVAKACTFVGAVHFFCADPEQIAANAKPLHQCLLFASPKPEDDAQLKAEVMGNP